ncbi:4-(cytidine 5'-diphospho)-2-C-methyl-D-erythritol kinase [Limihaloglobus sulfuriphilus]|nr:4-(cytidine 5'-diphospho)-2-C-methyl-D-erythritol kinase [Limihaloglobus sulfuriphilus]
MDFLTTSGHKPQFEEDGKKLIVNAPAKINIFLLITPRRPDGFHGVETLMTKISWYDQIIIEKTNKNDIELICAGDCWAPDDDTNLVYRAAELLREQGKLRHGVKLTLVKNIPAGTGLGSASSDCASTFLGINRMFELGMSDSEMQDYCSQLGSDIAFFIGEPSSICGGRGEIIIRNIDISGFKTLLAIPDVKVSTKEAYKNFVFDKTRYETLRKRIIPEISEKFLDLRPSMCANMLENVCFMIEPQLKHLKECIEQKTGFEMMVTGSGSAMFSLPGKKAVFDNEIITNVFEHCKCKGVIVNNNKW